jgi:ABC-type multidrug transport system fused ATPase/permease subunit
VENASLEIEAGEIVGVIGPSGAGKSTLVDLLVGLLEPETGRITIGGEDGGGVAGVIGYVPQTIFLIDDTLRKNIAFGVDVESIDHDAVARAVTDAQLEDFIAQLPEGLDTVVGEQGVRLSGGQRQRIGLARALYRDPSLMILDEATSALDVDTEKEVMRAVRGLRGRKTVIIISHRLSTVADADRIITIADGKVEMKARRSTVTNQAGSRW